MDGFVEGVVAAAGVAIAGGVGVALVILVCVLTSKIIERFAGGSGDWGPRQEDDYDERKWSGIREDRKSGRW